MTCCYQSIVYRQSGTVSFKDKQFDLWIFLLVSCFCGDCGYPAWLCIGCGFSVHTNYVKVFGSLGQRLNGASLFTTVKEKMQLRE